MFNINIKLKNLAQAALVTVCGLSTLALSSNTPAHAQTITGYTDINDPNGTYGTFVNGINNSGDIVGYYLNSSEQQVGFLYNDGTYTDINDPNGTYNTVAQGINNSGDIVGYYLNSSDQNVGFLYNGSTYTDINDPNGTNGTYPQGINNSGDVVGYYINSSNQDVGFLYNGSTYTNINFPGASSTGAYGINDNGQIVGTGDSSSFTANVQTQTAVPEPLNVFGSLTALGLGVLLRRWQKRTQNH